MCPVGGIYKADIGVRDGRIHAIGKAGNPAFMAGVSPNMVIGPGTKHINGQGLIATPGGIDVHAHYLQPAEVWHALSAGLTTMIGGGFAGCWAIDSGGDWANAIMLQATRRFPMNFGLFSRGGASRPGAIEEQLASGVIGVKIHEDLGAMPALIDTCLDVADRLDFQVQLHTDSMNESGFYETTMEAIAGRTIHMYHTEGRRWRTRARHHPLQRRTPLPAVLHLAHQSLHSQCPGRAHGHDDAVPHPERGRAGGCRLRREPAASPVHGRRGRAA